MLRLIIGMLYSTITVAGVDLGYSPNEPMQPGSVFEYGWQSYKVVSLNYKTRWCESNPHRALLQDCTLLVEEV